MIKKFRKSLDDGAEYAALLNDLSKVFDWHSLKITRSYLSERYQRVKINTLKEETFVEVIFANYDPICKNSFRKNEDKCYFLSKTLQFSKKTYKKWTRFEKIYSAKYDVFGILNHKYKFRRYFHGKQFLLLR